MKRAALIFRRSSVALLALAACAVHVGCRSGISNPLAKAASDGKVFAVTADKTSFFRYGPQQGNGPDQELPRDTLMTLIRPSFGYSKVQLVKGDQQGYVASEDIGAASPAVVAAAMATPPPVAAAGEPRGERFELNSSDPRLQPPPELLPAPDLPPAADSAPSGSPSHP